MTGHIHLPSLLNITQGVFLRAWEKKKKGKICKEEEENKSLHEKMPCKKGDELSSSTPSLTGVQ